MKLPASGKRIPAERLRPHSSSRPAAIYGPPTSPPRVPARRHRLRDDPRLVGMVQPRDGPLGDGEQVHRFRDVPPGTLKAGDIHPFPALVIIPSAVDALIEAVDDGCMLTSHRGSNNECRLIFRHAWARVRLELSVPSGAGDSHIGFLGYRDFEEVQGFSLVQPRNTRGNTGGSLRVSLDYRAGPLSELQGIVWRGGLLQIESVSLSP